MDRILINDDILKYAQMYEQAFRGYQLDVPTKLRNIKVKLNIYNVYNRLSLNVLDEYKAYVEEIAKDYMARHSEAFDPLGLSVDLTLNSVGQHKSKSGGAKQL